MEMDTKTALKAILVLAIAGFLFSGYLSYNEVFRPGGVTCTVSNVKILGVPACVYGFTMYAAIIVLAYLGLKGMKK
jgi:uncharacterized membrane protein